MNRNRPTSVERVSRAKAWNSGVFGAVFAAIVAAFVPAAGQCIGYDQRTNVSPITGTVGTFNGTTAYSSMFDGTWFNGGPFTITTWVRPRVHAYWNRVLDFGNGAPSDNVVLSTSSERTGQPSFVIFRGSTPYTVTSPNPIPLDRWTHLAAVYNGSTMVLFVNGQSVGSLAIPGGPSNVTRHSNLIAKSNWSGDALYHGDIAYVRIYNYGMDANAVAAEQYTYSGEGAGLTVDWRWEGFTNCTQGGVQPCMRNAIFPFTAMGVYHGSNLDGTQVIRDTNLRGVADACRAPLITSVSTNAVNGSAPAGSMVSVTVNLFESGASGWPLTPPKNTIRALLNGGGNGSASGVRNGPTTFQVGPLAEGDNVIDVRASNYNGFSPEVLAEPIRIIGRPTLGIVRQPVSVSVCAGSGATFSVGARGDNLTYQWMRNGAAIAGATGPTCVVAATTATTAGTYTVRVSSGSAGVTSSGAVLSIDATATQGECDGVASFLAPVIATEVVRSEYARLDAAGFAPNRKPRIAAVVAGIEAVAALNPNATTGQMASFVGAYDAALGAAFPDDPDLRRPVNFLAAVRSLARVAPAAADPASPLRGLNTDVQGRVLAALGAAVEVTPVDSGQLRRDNMVNLRSAYAMDFSLSGEFARVLTRGFRGQDDAGAANPLVEPSVTAYLRTQGIEPYPASLGGYPEILRAISMAPHTPAQLATALAAGFANERAQALGELDGLVRSISATIDAAVSADRGQPSLGAAMGPAMAQPQNVLNQIIAQRQLEASQQANARAMIGMLSTLMEQGTADDATFGSQLTQAWETTGRVLKTTSQVTQAVVGVGTVGYQLSRWGTEKFSWSSLGTGLGGAATAAGVLVSMFGPEPLASVAQSIFDPISAVRADIDRLRQEMNARFDRVDAQLTTIMDAVNSGFARVELGQRLALDEIRNTQSSMFQLQSNLDRLEGNLYGMLSTGFEQSFELHMNLALGARSVTGSDLPYNTPPEDSFYGYGTEFRTWATQFSANALYGGSSTTLLNDANAANVLAVIGADQQSGGMPPVGTPNPLGAALNNLRAFPSRLVAGAPMLGLSPVANPNTWSYAAEAFDRLGRENPWYFAQIYGNGADVTGIMSKGSDSQAICQMVSTYRFPGSSNGIFDQLLNDAGARVGAFDAAVGSEVSGYLLSRNISQWGIWGPPSQGPAFGSYPVVTLPATGEVAGFSSSTPVSPPPNLATNLPNELRNALYLGIVSPTQASGASGQPYLVITGTPVISYQFTTAGLDIYLVSVLIDVRVRWPGNTSVQAIAQREVYRFTYLVNQGNPAPTQQAVINDWNAAQGSFTFIERFSPQIGLVGTMVNNYQSSLQADYFNWLIGRLGSSGATATAAAWLESSRALLDSYLTIGLPTTYEASDAMRSILRGDELGLGKAGLVYYLQSQIDGVSAMNRPLTAQPSMAALWNDRINLLRTAIAPTKAAGYTAESHPLVTYTLASLRGLRDNARRLLNDDTYVVAPGQTLMVSWPGGVLANDATQDLDLELRRRPALVSSSLPSGHAFAFTTETRTLANGTTRTATFGGFTYTPPPGFTGDVVLQYTASVDLSSTQTPNIVTSDPANIRIRVVACAPSIATQPSPAALVAGGYATFSIVVNAAGAPSYQWRKNGAALADGVTASGTVIVGATTPTLRIVGAHTGDAGSYSCAVTTGCGQVVSAGAAYGSACAADFNNSGSLSPQDIFDYLNAWFALDPRADFNGSGDVSVQDLFDYLNAWFAGCP